MAFARVTDKQAVIMVFNNDTKPAEVSFDVSMIKQLPANAVLVDALGKVANAKVENGALKLTLPVRTAAILR